MTAVPNGITDYGESDLLLLLLLNGTHHTVILFDETGLFRLSKIPWFAKLLFRKQCNVIYAAVFTRTQGTLRFRGGPNHRTWGELMKAPS
ncbi:MAG: hypothetical protein K9W43_13955 [Candidatus Thorarchaeota archaeon]|nr:hypothetical protein [Candidatus Thorarchaeota archaeon]